MAPYNGSLFNDLPTHYSVLVAGPPGVGKFESFVSLAQTFLERGERVVFVTLDLHPREIRRRAMELGLDLDKYEGSTFVFVDAFSSSASEREDEPSPHKVFSVSSYSNLEGLGMAIAKAAHELKPPVRMVFYTISTLYLHNSSQAIAKFSQIVTNRVKTNMGFIAYAVHDGVHDSLTMNMLRSLVDGVFEMRYTETMERQIRAHHMRGMTVAPAWQTFAGEGEP